jgi:hypothetical protein
MLNDAYVSSVKVSAYEPEFCEVFFVSLHFVCDITKDIIFHLGILYRWKRAKVLGLMYLSAFGSTVKLSPLLM